MKYELRRTNPDGTKETLETSDYLSILELRRIARYALNEKLEVIDHADTTPEWKEMADKWKAKAVKHLDTLTKIGDILAENESQRQWIKDIVKIMLDSNIMDISEVEQYKL